MENGKFFENMMLEQLDLSMKNNEYLFTLHPTQKWTQMNKKPKCKT